MSTEGASGPQSGTNQVGPEGDPRPKSARRDPLGTVWRFFAAPPVLLGLVALLVLALTLAAVVPQIPAGAGDPQAWWAVHSSAFGPAAGLIGVLGLFDVYHAYWFTLLLVLIGLSLLVWMVDSAELAWYAGGQERWTAAAFAHWGKHAPLIDLTSSLPLQEAETELQDCLTQLGYRSTRVPGLPSPSLVASRRGPALWSVPLLFGALLAALVGLAISDMWGWQNGEWWAAPGESQSVGHGSRYTVRLDGFQVHRATDGRLQGYESAVTWLLDGTEVGQAVTLPGKPARRQGVAVRLVGFSPAVRVRGRDSSGHSLVFQVGGEGAIASAEAEVSFPNPTTQQLVLIYGREEALALAFEPLSSDGKPTLYLTTVDQSGARQQAVALHQSGAVQVDGLQAEVDLEYRPILRLDYRPGMGLVIPASAMAVLALAVRWLLAPRLLWITLRDGPRNSTMVNLLPEPHSWGRRWPWQLVARLQEALQRDA